MERRGTRFPEVLSSNREAQAHFVSQRKSAYGSHVCGRIGGHQFFLLTHAHGTQRVRLRVTDDDRRLAEMLREWSRYVLPKVPGNRADLADLIFEYQPESDGLEKPNFTDDDIPF